VHKFDPYQFGADMTKQLVNMLQKADDALNAKELAQAASVPIEHKNHTNIWVFIVGLLVAALSGYFLLTA